MRLRRRQVDPEDESVAEEVEAFLAGRYLEYLKSRHALVPTWAWLNPVAHGRRADIEALASKEFTGPQDPYGLASFLARELLSAADRDGVTVEELQASRLRPLEQDLITMADRGIPGGRSWLARLVVSALCAPARP